VLVNAVFVTALINLVVNWLIARGAVGDRASIPFWGPPLVEPSVFWDLVGTLFLLPLVTGGLTTAAVRRDIRRGSLSRLGEGFGGGRSDSGWRRGAELGGVAVFSTTPPLLLIFAVLGFPEMSDSTFVAWHTALAIALGLVVTPPLAMLAMGERR
jgi:hypothetical protein